MLTFDSKEISFSLITCLSILHCKKCISTLSNIVSTNFVTAMEGSTYRNIYTNRYHDTTKRFQGFVKLFMVWKGSVIKLIWHDLLVFIVGYFTVSLLYQHVFLYHEAVAQYFEMICIYCEKYTYTFIFSNLVVIHNYIRYLYILGALL